MSQPMSLDVLDALASAWVFTSSHPLTTEEVVTEAKRRGVELDTPLLRELYRRGFLTPLLEVMERRVSEPRQVVGGPQPRGTRQSQVLNALNRGSIRDLTTTAFRPRMRFDRAGLDDPHGWWNGLVYSRWQLLALADIRPYLSHQRRSGPYENRRVRLPEPKEFLVTFDQWTRAAVVITALEARYLPLVRPRWIQVTNAEPDEWRAYRTSFDPVAVASDLGIDAAFARNFAERLLMHAKRIDPLGTWARLVRRSIPKAWETLNGDALIAHEMRLAAEILLLFYEDLASKGAADPLPVIDGGWHHPLLDRISDRQDGSLDRLLAAKGISPHPGVVLMVEGESEFHLVGRIRDHLSLGRDPDTIQVVCMRSADRQLALLAAATVAPILGDRREGSFEMIRPPTHLVIAVDPDDRWDTDAKIKRQKQLVIDEIVKVVAAQSAALDPDVLDQLVEIHTWNGASFEFAHFSDNELADGLQRISEEAARTARDELVGQIAEVRRRKRDLRQVWSQWNHKPSKIDLADALWPIMAASIDAAKRGEVDAPELAAVVQEAHRLALNSNIGTFVIASAPE